MRDAYSARVLIHVQCSLTTWKPHALAWLPRSRGSHVDVEMVMSVSNGVLISGGFFCGSYACVPCATAVHADGSRCRANVKCGRVQNSYQLSDGHGLCSNVVTFTVSGRSERVRPRSQHNTHTTHTPLARALNLNNTHPADARQTSEHHDPLTVYSMRIALLQYQGKLRKPFASPVNQRRF